MYPYSPRLLLLFSHSSPPLATSILPLPSLTLHPYSFPPSASDSQYKPAIKELEVGVTDHFVLNATHYMEGMEGYCWWSVKSAASKECGRGNGTCQKKRIRVVRCAVRMLNTVV